MQGCRNWDPISNFSVSAFLPHLGNCFILGFFISKRIGLMGVCLLCQIPWTLYMLPECSFSTLAKVDMTKNLSMELIFDSWRIASTIEDRFHAWGKDQTRNDWWSLKFKTTMPFLKKEKGDTTKSRNTGQHIHLWTKLACLILVGMQCYCCCLSSQEVHSVDLSAQSWWLDEGKEGRMMVTSKSSQFWPKNSLKSS